MIKMVGKNDFSSNVRGILAVTSTLPYLIVAPSFVLRRADFAGGTIVPFVIFVEATQSAQ